MEKHLVHVTAYAYCKVTYNYEVKDLEKLKKVIEEKRDNLSTIHDLWTEGILGYQNDCVEYINVDLDSVSEDTSYEEVFGSSDEVQKIIYDFNMDQLEECSV